MEGGSAPPEEDFSKLPLEDRLLHKNWKARSGAYEDLVKTFRTTVSEDDPAFNTYLRDPTALRAFIVDSNAVCQEKGVEACCAFVEFGGKNAASKAKEQLMQAIVEKNVFGVARAGTKKALVELCLLLVECAEDAGEGVLVPLATDGIKSKQPKAVAGAVNAMKEVVKQFGVKAANPKPVLKAIPAIFAHADKTVRAEGTSLVQELHRWLGGALDAHLADLKPVQIKELNESFAGEVKGEQTRLTRTQQREKALREAEATLNGTSGSAADAAAGDGAEVGPGEEAEPDAFDFSEPQPILDKLPNGFYENLASSKWKERKEEALDPLLETLKKAPRIADSPSYDELVRALAGRMTDANIMCVISAAGCIEHLANGLRAAFARYKPIVTAPLLERCKEKKASVTDALSAALDATFQSVTISDIVEDVAAFAKHKNPQVKEQLFKFLIRSLRTTRVAPSLKTDLKPLADALLSGIEDSFEPVRSAAAEGLGTLSKILGERALGPTLEGLDDIKKAKVKDFAEKAEVKYRPGARGPAAGASAAAKPIAPRPVAAAPQPKPQAKPKPQSAFVNDWSEKENALPDASPAAPPTPRAAAPVKPAVRKPPVLSSATAPKKPVVAAAPVVAASSSKAAQHKPAPNEPLKYRYTQEDAEAQAEAALPAEMYADLGNANWKLRLAALDAMHAWATDGEGAAGAVESELVVRVLSKKPGWKESNFQVYGRMAAVFQALAERSPNWSRACSALTIPALSDKLGDIKIKKPAGDALTAYAEKFSLQFVLSHAYEPMTKQKAPKAQADSLLWVEQSLRDFGIQGLVVRDMIEFLKTGLKSSNASVRTNATKTLVTLRLYVGPDIKTFIQDLNPALLTTIDSEFDKVASEQPPAATRTSGDNAAPTAGGAGKGGKGAAGGADALDDLFPRQDIDKLVPNAVIAACNDANWKTRKESLEQIQGILEANKRLKPSMGDLGGALKLRMSDSNKMVQALALDIVARLASGMHKPFEKFARLFVSPVAAVLSDAKPHVRAPALVALSAIFEQTGLDCMVGSLAASLETPNPIQRKELATWLGDKLKEGNSEQTDLAPLAAPTIACLEDKSADVRKAAQAILPYIVASAGYQHVLDQTSGLKPASRSTVIPMIDAARSAAPAPGKPMGAPASGPVSANSEVSRPSSTTSSNPPLSSTLAAKVPGSIAARGTSAMSRSLKPAAVSVSNGSSTANSTRSGTPTEAVASTAKTALVRKPTGARQSLVPAARLPVQPSFSPTGSTSGSASPANEPPFLTNDPKAKVARGSRETGPLRWQIEGSARSDQVEYLQHQMLPHTSAQLIPLLFSKDHHAERDFMAALTVIGDASTPAAAESYGLDVADLRLRLTANADLIFKYLTVRLADTATIMTIKCLEVIEAMFAMMLEDGYQLSDYEAGALLPSLITKLGDGKETIRNRVKAIIRSTGSIYPSSKTFSSLLEHGLHSKNARTRSESADELGYLFQRQGLSVCQPSKALPVIASLISDKDAACRSSALAAIAQAYTMVGDAVYKYIGTLPDKERTMLDEKLKRTNNGAASPAPARTAPSGSATPKRPDSRQEALVRPDSRTGATALASRVPSGSSSTVGVGAKRRQSALPMPAASAHASYIPPPGGSHLRESHLPQPPSRTAGSKQVYSTSPDQPLSMLQSQKHSMVTDEAEPLGMQRQLSLDPASPFAAVLSPVAGASVDALKAVQRRVTESPDELAMQADALMEALSAQMASAFEGLDARTPQSTLRLCKHLMQTLSGFFDQKTLSLAVSKDSLIVLLGELTKRLLETAASEASEAITSLSKVLNMVLIRIFHNADRSSTFGALFAILQRTTADLRELSAADLAERAKYAELVMKCLWKVSKSVKETLEDESLDARRLLLYIDGFLTVVPPAEWRRRASDNIPLGDMPLRTIKTILQQVVANFGDAVYDELALIDRPENSFVYQYLYRLLSNSRQASSAGSSSAPLSRQSSTLSQFAAGPSAYTMSRQSTTGSQIINGKAMSPSLNGASASVSASPSMQSAGTTSPGRSNDIEMNLALKEIFDRIGNAQESKKGIAELYEFQKQHPEAEARINTWIQATGSFFQSYLKRALSNLAAEEAERSPKSSPASRPESVFANNVATPDSPAPAASVAAPASPFGGARGERASRVPSANSDERLNSLKQLFGVPARTSTAAPGTAL